jgi:hypothetical protein
VAESTLTNSYDVNNAWNLTLVPVLIRLARGPARITSSKNQIVRHSD